MKFEGKGNDTNTDAVVKKSDRKREKRSSQKEITNDSDEHRKTRKSTKTNSIKQGVIIIIPLLEAIVRRLSLLKMNGKTGFLYELGIIVDKMKELVK